MNHSFMNTFTLFSFIFISLFIHSLSKSFKSFSSKDNLISIPLSPTHSNITHLSLVGLKAILKSLENITKDTYSQYITKKIYCYSGEILIGNPPQKMEVLFDTGSSNILLSSTNCNSSVCEKHRRYDPIKSISHKNISLLDNPIYEIIRKEGKRDTVNINFGTGEAKCLMAYEDICIGINNDLLCANQTIILEAYELSSVPFSDVDFDGIIGLSFNNLSVSYESNFMDMLFNEGKISKRAFGFYFNKDDSKKSQLTIGGYDPQFLKGKLNFVNLVSDIYWEIKLDGIYYDDTLIIDCKKGDKEYTAVLDTGTAMIAAPMNSFNIIEKYLNVDPSCSNFNLMKHLSFEINGIKYPIDPEYYIFKVPDDDGKEEICLTAIMKLNILSDSDKHTFILGMPFLKKYYTVFDIEQKRIGLALSNHNNNI